MSILKSAVKDGAVPIFARKIRVGELSSQHRFLYRTPLEDYGYARLWPLLCRELATLQPSSS